MAGLELVIALGLAVLASGALARRSGVAFPVLLLGCGALLGFVPAQRMVQLPPEIMLLLFLPALLYWESLNTSLREIRTNWSMILMLSTAFVVVVAGMIAAIAHALGMSWGPAWVLGAAVAPTDATAVAALTRSLPRQLVTVIRAESLVNDGTALVIYGLAVSLTVRQARISPAEIIGRFFLSYAGGMANGPPSSGCVTKTASTTPSCAGSRRTSTPRRSGWPAVIARTDDRRARPEPYRYAAAQLGVDPRSLVLAAVHPWDRGGARTGRGPPRAVLDAHCKV